MLWNPVRDTNSEPGLPVPQGPTPYPFTPDMCQNARGVLGLDFAGYVPQAYQNPYPVIV